MALGGNGTAIRAPETPIIIVVIDNRQFEKGRGSMRGKLMSRVCNQWETRGRVECDRCKMRGRGDLRSMREEQMNGNIRKWYPCEGN